MLKIKSTKFLLVVGFLILTAGFFVGVKEVQAAACVWNSTTPDIDIKSEAEQGAGNTKITITNAHSCDDTVYYKWDGDPNTTPPTGWTARTVNATDGMIEISQSIASYRPHTLFFKIKSAVDAGQNIIDGRCFTEAPNMGTVVLSNTSIRVDWSIYDDPTPATPYA